MCETFELTLNLVHTSAPLGTALAPWSTHVRKIKEGTMAPILYPARENRERAPGPSVTEGRGFGPHSLTVEFIEQEGVS